MHWQDPALTVAQLFFTVALFPSIMSKDKPAFATSAMNGAVAAGIACVYVSLALWFAAGSAALNSAFWLFLALQKHVMDRARPPDALR